MKIEVDLPMYSFTENRIDSPPKGFCNGIAVKRCDAKIYKYDCVYHFFDQVKTVVKEPLLTGINPRRSYHYIFSPAASRYCEKLNIYHLKNAYVQHKITVVLSTGEYLKLCAGNRNFNQDVRNGTIIKPKYGYRVLFFVPIIFPKFFSHWITDGLSAIVLMPRWFWDLNPTILCVSVTNYVRYSLELMGLGHIDVIDTQNFVYGDDVFFVHANELWNCMGLYAAKVIKQKYREALGLDKIEPVNYRFIGKDNDNRRFTNLDELIELANKRTGKNWALITTKFAEREAYAREFASCLVLVISAGSQPYNCIFMKDGTGIVSLCCGQIDSPQFTYCFNINIWNIGVIHPEMRLVNHALPANVNLTLDTIDKMIYTVEHQHYPPDIDLFQPFWMEDSKKAYFEHGDLKFIGTQGFGDRRREAFARRKR